MAKKRWLVLPSHAVGRGKMAPDSISVQPPAGGNQRRERPQQGAGQYIHRPVHPHYHARQTNSQCPQWQQPDARGSAGQPDQTKNWARLMAAMLWPEGKA